MSWGLSGCLGTRYLQENQKLLYRQNIEAPRKFNTAPLQDLYVKEVNRRFLGLPINTLVWMHHEGETRYNKQKFIDRRAAYIQKFDQKITSTKNQKKITRLQYRRQQKIDAMNSKIENGNNFMQWGEAAAVYDSLAVEATKDRFKDYLFTKGYFQNTVSYRTQEYKKRVSVTYEIKPGAPYIYDTIFYEVPDTRVMALVVADKGNSLIKPYSQYDQDKLNKERERIDFFLKDQGYFDFSRQYIEYSIDTSYKAGHRLALQIKINNPGHRNSHVQFELDSVIFTTDAAVNARDNLKRHSTPYRQITFQYFNDQYSKKILAQRVFIKKDSLYNRTSTLNTQRQLANLDIFKFININYDTSGGKFIANIFSSPLDRYAWSNEAGVTVTQGFPGPYYSTNFKKRNVFRGLEIVEINGRFGFEGVASATRVGNFYKSTDASINGSITFPQFLLPMKESSAFKLARYNPRTRLLAGYAYTDRPEYQRSTTTVSNTYTWENKQVTRYSFTLINLNIIRSRLDHAFDSLLTYLQENQGNNLKNSFKPSFVSSMIFSVTWNPDNYGNTERTSHIIRFQAETGGTLFNFATPDYIVRQGLELYKFVRFNVDVRRSQVLNRNTVVAYRLNAGAGYSYNTNEVLPYEKYFFVGGSNSVRAWRPRRLGVGSSPPELATDPRADGLFDYRFEKPGEILLEGSIEARRKLFAFVNGAVFLDFGNVWSFREIQLSGETSGTKAGWQGSTKFDGNFYKQLGVGTGFGLRFDFSFLVLRIDAGIKVYDPGRADGDRFVLNKFKFFRPFGTNKEPVIFNVGIGYPF
jgi:outer membrane protein insertion porin family